MKETLEALYAQYRSAQYLDSDPLALVHNHIADEERDIEVIALLCALFAYGRVSAIQSFLQDLLESLSDHPSDFLARTTPASLDRVGLPYYRFQSARDVRSILLRIGALIRESNIAHRSGGQSPLPLERHFGNPSTSTILRIAHFQRSFLQGVPKSHRTPGLLHWIGQADGRGARKRLCMFLRWMVRKEHPDLGLYSSFSPDKLIVPLDVHIGRIGRNLNLTSRKTQDWEMAAQISGGLSRLCPEDPLRYDFALTRPGILGQCRGTWHAKICPNCELRTICAQTEGRFSTEGQ
ncbi:MAG: TIGR02757 family protein [Leptospiraceae bacterium]|nr:TIGR02757 family protein [Leptospiraceae bacterium]